jgi:hypothetical protein
MIPDAKKVCQPPWTVSVASGGRVQIYIDVIDTIAPLVIIITLSRFRGPLKPQGTLIVRT